MLKATAVRSESRPPASPAVFRPFFAHDYGRYVSPASCTNGANAWRAFPEERSEICACVFDSVADKAENSTPCVDPYGTPFPCQERDLRTVTSSEIEEVRAIPRERDVFRGDWRRPRHILVSYPVLRNYDHERSGRRASHLAPMVSPQCGEFEQDVATIFCSWFNVAKFLSVIPGYLNLACQAIQPPAIRSQSVLRPSNKTYQRVV